MKRERKSPITDKCWPDETVDEVAARYADDPVVARFLAGEVKRSRPTGRTAFKRTVGVKKEKQPRALNQQDARKEKGVSWSEGNRSLNWPDSYTGPRNRSGLPNSGAGPVKRGLS